MAIDLHIYASLLELKEQLQILLKNFQKEIQGQNERIQELIKDKKKHKLNIYCLIDLTIGKGLIRNDIAHPSIPQFQHLLVECWDIMSPNSVNLDCCNRLVSTKVNQVKNLRTFGNSWTSPRSI